MRTKAADWQAAFLSLSHSLTLFVRTVRTMVCYG